ncbi:MAG: ABC transporter ATP-binding protein [Gemmatimonadales bacterium]|nr:MAG: ABC transporter ATP-binding protein [Gemmatimonadales bacterium]
MADAEVLLRADGVVKTYGERVVTTAVRGVDLTFSRGEFCALTGPSGCGKTTLLNILGLLDRPTEGRVWIEGRDTTPLDDDERTRLRAETLGFIFQSHHLLMAFTALENVMIPLLSRHGRRAPWMREKAEGLLEQMGLADRIPYRATDLSGGEQQRVAVARALAMDPALVLADEPTGNLDTESGSQVFQALREIRRERGTAFLIVTHDQGIAAGCDRVVHMVDGRIAADTRPTDGRPGSRG